MKRLAIYLLSTALFLGAMYLVALIPPTCGETDVVRLEVENAPDKYYVTVLEKEEYPAAENSPNRVEKFDDDVVVAFFDEYSYDGWTPRTTTLHIGVRKRDVEAGDDYGLSWIVTHGPIRVALVDEQGEVHLSKELSAKEDVIHATYDVATGEFTEQRGYWIRSRYGDLLMCFMLTVVSTLLVLVLFRLPLSGWNLFVAWIANLVAYIPLSYCVRHLFIDRNGDWYHAEWWLIGEAVVAVAGVFAGTFLLKTEDGKRARYRGASCFVVAVIAGIFAATMLPELVF